MVANPIAQPSPSAAEKVVLKTLVIGISSSALFDTRESDNYFLTHTLAEYVAYQRQREDQPFLKGTAFPLVSALLDLNQRLPKPCFELVVLSKNEPEAGLRVMNSLDHFRFKNTRAAFTGGEPIARYCQAFGISLFLSRETAEVKDALKLGVAAGVLYDPPENPDVDVSKVRIAFDWDGVLGSTDAEVINLTQGLEAFRAHETKHVLKPLPPGPFEPVLRVLTQIKAEFVKAGGGVPPIEIALVTARNPPAHKRVMLTLRHWGVELDQLFLLGGRPKAPVLKVFRPHIFFDDQEQHTQPASTSVSTGLVPWIDKEPDVAPPTGAASTPSRHSTKGEFASTCRRIFEQYTPRIGAKARPLDPRFRDFIKVNSGRSGPERAAILERLKRYELLLPDHDPKLNRDRRHFLAKRLRFLAEGRVENQQEELDLEAGSNAEAGA